ncbi:MAG: hypothetical protein HN380_10220 [Victivallales bacterium]|nr:hypothetical protein [Victivallales bacterium]
MGKGIELSDGACVLKALDGDEFSASLRLVRGVITISTTAACQVTVGGKTTTIEAGLSQKL